jgi:hypothetical protein
MNEKNVELPVKGIVPINQMTGEDANETELFQLAASAAEKYLRAFPWCRQILESYFGDGVGGVVEVFFFRILPSRPGVDEWLWVVVGDIPPAYLVTDGCKSPSEALEGYIQQVSKWVALAKQGRSSEKVIPVSVSPTPEEAAILEKRLDFLRDFALPRFRDGETERA